MAIMSGFWLSFMQLFDLLPNFIVDWVDSSGIVRALQLPAMFTSATPRGTMIAQEWMINANSFLIIFCVVWISHLVARLRRDPSGLGTRRPTHGGQEHAALNDINFPAGVLMPPLFDPRLDDAPNYGNTGGTIGHELIHGFDDEGRRFLPDGGCAGGPYGFVETTWRWSLSKITGT